MGCSLPGSSVHGIFQAIALEWIAISFSRGSSQPRDGTRVSRIVDRCFRAFNKGLEDVGASLVAQTVKNLPAMQETCVQSLDREDPLEKGMTAHSNILAWRIPWTEEPGGLRSMGCAKSRTRLSD